MKKFLSLFILLTPLISLSMEKGGQPVRKDASKKAVVPVRDEAELVRLEEVIKDSLERDKKDVYIGNEEREAFIACLTDMRYYHLQNPELKETYKTVVKLAQMEQASLKKETTNSTNYIQWPTGGEALHRAQIRLANTIALLCPVEDFNNHVKTVCGLVAKKHGSSNGKDVAVDMDSFSVFNEILTNYDALTGTTFKDMASKADEHLALRLAGKIAAKKSNNTAEKK